MADELNRPTNPVAVEEVAREITAHLSEVDGITISGGEPFDQAEALCHLLGLLKQYRDPEVLIYTGYLLEELHSFKGPRRKLLGMTDILIDGPFIQDQPNTLQWRGSDNQRVRLLSARSLAYAEIVDNRMPEVRSLQFQVLGNDTIRLIGIPRRGDIDLYHDLLESRGLKRRVLNE